MIERFTRGNGNTFSIYYTISTWNPYTTDTHNSVSAIQRPGGEEGNRTHTLTGCRHERR
jgi:hypothetical protein